MTTAARPLDIEAITAQHERLADLAEQVRPDDVDAVLVLGAAVLLHGLLEPAHLGPVLGLVDPTVEAEMALDHQRLADDLGFLEELAGTEPGSADIAVLAGAILERLRLHLRRDQGALYAPLARLRAAEEPRT